MSTIKIEDIFTLSITVTEEIESKNLHTFLKTSILNNNINISKNTYYYFFYNKNNKTYEIIYFENNANSNIELFDIVKRFNQNDNLVRTFIAPKYFIIAKNDKVLILKKTTDVIQEDIKIYIEQMYKIKEFELVELTQKDKNILELEPMNRSYNNCYPLYIEKSFYFFSSFVVISLIIFVIINYLAIDRKEKVKNTGAKQETLYKNNYLNISKKVAMLFTAIGNENIILDKVSYNNNRMKTILYHQNKLSLFAFTKNYYVKMDIKSLIYNEQKKMFQMEVVFEY